MELDQKSHVQSAKFEKAAFITLLATLVLGFLGFVPTSLLPLAAVKTFVIGIGTLIAVIFFLLAKMKAKSLKVSSHPVIWIAGATALVILLSSLFSPSVVSSFFGKDFAVDTAAFLLILFISSALTFSLTKGHENRTFLVFSAILGSFSLLAIFHIVRFFAGANFLALGTFTSTVYTTVGSWHDLGIFAGLALIISLVTLQLLPITNKLARSLFIAAFTLAAIILVVVDLQSVWLVVAITLLAFSVYKYILNSRHKKGTWTAHLPVFAIITTVIALILAWSPGIVGNFISTDVVTKLGASYSEINLPWGLTMDIAEPTIKSSPILGAGPDRFVNQYLQYKPEIVNATPFWSSDFSNGAGFVLTTLVTEGILGFVLWIALIVAFIWFGARNLLSRQGAEQSEFVRYGTAASYFGGGLLWLSLITYMPQHAILLVLFVLTGIFAAHIVSAPAKAVHFIEGPKKLPAVILLWLLIAVSAVAIIYFAKAAVAEAYFQVAIQDLNNGGSLSVSAQKIQSALKFNKSDVYYQAIAQMDVYAVNEIVSNATTTPSEETVDLIGGLVNDGINSAKLAQKFDPTNPYNYLSEAQVAVVAAGIGIQGAYADATSTYAKALTLDPFDPSIYLDAAKLEFFEKNTAVAEADLNTALELKPDYTDALFEAGVISYTNGDYATAVQAFTQVQQIDSTYSNIQQAIDVAKSAESGSGTSSGTAAPVVTTPPASTATTTPATAASGTAGKKGSGFVK